MIILRFKNTRGETEYGVLPDVPPDGQVRQAEQIKGNIFGDYYRTGRTTAVTKLLAPVDPPNVVAIGLNYRDHAAEAKMALPDEPVIFFKATTAVIGPGDPIVLPPHAADEVDYEAELTVIIGRRAKNVPPERVNDVILGYTCGNDVSARDCQLKKDKQWARAKSFDTFCPLGPWIVTADQLDPSDLAIRTLLNGQRLQDSRTSQLVVGVPELVSYLSRQFTLLPGTVIMTGTPKGVGLSYDPPRYLHAGDEVVIEIDGIGRLANPVKRSDG